MTSLRALLKVSTMSVALLGGVAFASMVVTADTAYAGKGNGNGGGSGGGGGNSGDKGASSDKGKDGAKGATARSGGKTKTTNGTQRSNPIKSLRSLFKSEDKPAKANTKRTVVKRKAAAKSAPAKSSAPKPKGNLLASTLGVHPSELGALNAANASPNALANASPKSRVGKIAIYANEVESTRELIADLEAAQAELDGLEAPTRSIEQIDEALSDAANEKMSLEGDLAELNEALDAAGGSDETIEGQIADVTASLEETNGTIADLEQERLDGEAYAAADDQVARLEGEVGDQTATQREALEAAANKEVTDDVEIAVQKLLGIYEEPEVVEEEALEEDTVASE